MPLLILLLLISSPLLFIGWVLLQKETHVHVKRGTGAIKGTVADIELPQADGARMEFVDA